LSPRGLATCAGELALVALALVFFARRPRENVRAQPSPIDTESSTSPQRIFAEPTPTSTASAVHLTPAPAATLPGERTEVGTHPSAVPVSKAPLFVLHGTVLGPSGERLRDRSAYVSATDASGERMGASVTPEGHYSLAGLAPGSWTLSASALGHRMEQASVELGASQPIVRRDFELVPSLVLPVYVLTPSGEPLNLALRSRGQSGARNPVRPLPVATREPPGATIDDAIDAGNNRVGVGSFWNYGPLVEAAPPGVFGVLEIEGDLPVHVSLVVGARALATQLVAAGTEQVSFTVDIDDLLEQQALVRVRFVDDATGAVLSGHVEIEPTDASYRVADGILSQTLAPGRYTLRFWSDGHARIPVPVELAAGQELDFGEVRVPLELTIEGRLLDADGQPVYSLLEVGRRDGDGKLHFDQSLVYQSDASGRFEIIGLVPGHYLLRTKGDDEVIRPGREDPPTVWVSGNVPVSTLGGSVEGLDLHLVRAGILGLKGAPTQPEGTRIKILDEHGDLLRWSAIYPGFVPRFALPPGPCTLVLCDEDWNERSRHALVIAAGVNELDVTR
jgi:hypothetical protein